jgi:DNA-directed RNA polymerase subunit RPC12/RpoP
MVIPAECTKCSNSEFYISSHGYTQEIQCKTCGHKISYSVAPQKIEEFKKIKKKALTGAVLTFTAPILFTALVALIGGFIALIRLISA